MSNRVENLRGKFSEDFLSIKEIGNGTFGQVLKVQKAGTQEFFAMKVINISKLNAKDVEHAETEIRNLKTLSHENLVRYVSDFRKDGGKKICIVMELCDCTLRKYQAEKECGLTEQEVDNLLLQISHGLKYMHDREVLHRDIKPTNILVCGSKDPNPVFKMADFGLARQINVPVDGFTKYVGTLSFMSPEMVRGHCYNKSTDIWSLACCAYEVTTGVKVEVDKRGNLLRERSWENWTYSECLKDLLQSMFQLDPEKRPTVDGILVAIETKRHPQETKLHSLETKPDAQTHSRIPRVKKEHLAVENLNLSHSCPAGFLEESDDNEMEDTPRESYFIKQVQVKMSKSNADYLKWAEHCYMSLVDKLHSDIYMDQIEAAINETMDHCSEEVFLEKMKLLLPPKKFKRCEVYLKNYRNYMSALYKTPLMPSFRGVYLKKH